MDQIAYRKAEAAKLLGIGETKLKEEIRKGTIEARRFGRVVLIPAEALRAFVANLPAVKKAA